MTSPLRWPGRADGRGLGGGSGAGSVRPARLRAARTMGQVGSRFRGARHMNARHPRVPHSFLPVLPCAVGLKCRVAQLRAGTEVYSSSIRASAMGARKRWPSHDPVWPSHDPVQEHRPFLQVKKRAQREQALNVLGV